MRKLLRGVAAAVALIVLLAATPLAATNQETAAPIYWDADGQSWHLNQNRGRGTCWPDTRDLRALESLIVAKGCLEEAKSDLNSGLFWKIPFAWWNKEMGIRQLGYATHPLQDKDGHNDYFTVWIDTNWVDLSLFNIPRVEGTWAHGMPFIDEILGIPFIDKIPIINGIYSYFIPTIGRYADEVNVEYTEYGITRLHFEDALKSRDETWDVLSRFNRAYGYIFDRWMI